MVACGAPDDPLLGTWQQINADYVFLPSAYKFEADGNAYLADDGWGTWRRIDDQTIEVCGGTGCEPLEVMLYAGLLVFVLAPETFSFATTTDRNCCPDTFIFRPYAVSAGPTDECPEACSGMGYRTLTRTGFASATSTEHGDCACNIAGGTGTWSAGPAGFNLIGTTVPGSYVRFDDFISTSVYQHVELP